MKKHLGRFSVLGIGAAVLIAVGMFRYDLPFPTHEPHPAIEVDREVQLGEHELSSTVEFPLVVRNRGSQPLVVDEIETTCGCLGVFVAEESGLRAKVTRLEIPSHGRATLFPQLAVVGRPRIPETRKFSFRTNDLRNPRVEISMHVVPIAHYFTTPAELALGTVLVGERVEREIEVRAMDQNLPLIERASSSNERVHVRYERVPAISDAKGEAESSVLIGHLRIRFDAPSGSEEVGGAISLFCQGREQSVVMIPITGGVSRLIELTPMDVRLPRISGSGSVYSASCLCRAALSKPLRLAVQGLPENVAIRIKDFPENPSLKLIQIDAARLKDKVPAAGLEMPIKLTAHAGGQNIPLTLKLTVCRQ